VPGPVPHQAAAQEVSAPRPTEVPPVTTSFARNVPLADYTTLGLGGPAARFCSVASTDELIATVRDVDRSGDPLLVLGGGSNLVVADEGFAGTVIQVDSSDLSYTEVDDTVVRVRVDAGMEWDSFVARCVDEGLSGRSEERRVGKECRSGWWV